MLSIRFLACVLALTGEFLSVSGLATKRQDFNAQTSFLFDSSCDATKQSVIKQAHNDALAFAGAALEWWPSDDDESGHWYIDFDTELAIDFWGSPSKKRTLPRENHGYA